MTVNQSDPVNLACSADGYPKPTITWKKNNNIMNKSFIVRGKRDEGLYVCTADNGIGNASSALVIVTVKCKSKCVKCQYLLQKQMETRLECSFAIFRVPKGFFFKARLSANNSFENEYNVYEIKTHHFHIKGFKLSLVLKQTPETTRKWPTNQKISKTAAGIR